MNMLELSLAMTVSLRVGAAVLLVSDPGRAANSSV
jgi:hypothetical protein